MEGDLTVFSFDSTSAGVFLRSSGGNSRIEISGEITGGRLNGTVAQCNELLCVVENPRVYTLHFEMNDILFDNNNRQLFSFFHESDGGYIENVETGRFKIAPSNMYPGAANFFVNLGQYRGLNTSLTGYGWVQLPDRKPQELMYRDWGFTIEGCPCGPLCRQCDWNGRCSTCLDSAKLVNGRCYGMPARASESS